MTKRAEKRLQLREKQLEQASKIQPEVQTTPLSSDSIKSSKPLLSSNPSSNSFFNNIAAWYAKNLYKMEIIPILLIILAVCQIGFQMYNTHGDFINKDISLKGGLTITIATSAAVNLDEISSYLLSKGFVVNVRSIESSGNPVAILIEADVDFNDRDKTQALIEALKFKFPMTEGTYSLEGLGSAIGSSFFSQTVFALLISFVLMSIVVIVSFRTFVPCVAVIIAVISDMLMTIATINLLGIKVSLAGIAALIMLIGYSVDTDILLTTRVLRKHEGTIMDRVVSSARTGIMCSLTTMAVTLIGMLISSSEVIKQIMIIIFIGMIYDQINTWIQNAIILRRYAEKLESKDKL
jgi:preprotein translocase subunit SecF